MIDLAGRQRMLNQRHLKEVLLHEQGVTTDHRATRRLFDETLAALRDGGRVRVGAHERELPPTRDAELLVPLGRNEKRSRAFGDAVETYIALDRHDPRRADALATPRR